MEKIKYFRLRQSIPYITITTSDILYYNEDIEKGTRYNDIYKVTEYGKIVKLPECISKIIFDYIAQNENNIEYIYLFEDYLNNSIFLYKGKNGNCFIKFDGKYIGYYLKVYNFINIDNGKEVCSFSRTKIEEELVPNEVKFYYFISSAGKVQTDWFFLSEKNTFPEKCDKLQVKNYRIRMNNFFLYKEDANEALKKLLPFSYKDM